MPTKEWKKAGVSAEPKWERQSIENEGVVTLLVQEGRNLLSWYQQWSIPALWYAFRPFSGMSDIQNRVHVPWLSLPLPYPHRQINSKDQFWSRQEKDMLLKIKKRWMRLCYKIWRKLLRWESIEAEYRVEDTIWMDSEKLWLSPPGLLSVL